MAQRAFEETVLPHLDAAFNYALWLTGSDAEAEEVVQDACLRAMRFYSSLRGDDGRAWLFTIVRNTWYSRFARRGGTPETTTSSDTMDDRPDEGLDPEALPLQQDAVTRVRRALEQLPGEFREVIVLREIEGLAYREIVAVMQVPIGTVMSRLARARDRLLTMVKISPEPIGRLP